MGNTEQRPWERPKERVRVRLCTVYWEGVSRTRLPVPLLTTRAPWDPQLSWTWQTSCDGKALFSFDARYAAQAVTVDDTKCKESVQNWDRRLLVRILWLWHLMLRHLGLRRDQGTRLVGPRALERHPPHPRLHLCGALARGGRGDA